MTFLPLIRILALSIIAAVVCSPVANAATTANDDDIDIPLASAEAPANDSLERFNRPVFSFNVTLDKYVLKPVARGYHWVFPDVVRESIGNVFDNLGEPVNCINGILQLNPQKSFTAFWRFTLNSTFGFAGLRDFAGHDAGLIHHKYSFGETLETYGVGSGSYLVVPLLGPSTVRDAAGDVVDTVIDPFTYITPARIDNALTVVEVVDQRDQNATLIDEIYDNSLEPYIAMRSAYLQNKSFVSRNGKIKQLDD